MVDSVPPDEGCEVLDGEVTDEKWDKNGNRYFADSDDTQNLMKLGGGGHYKVQQRVKNFKKCDMIPYN